MADNHTPRRSVRVPEAIWLAAQGKAAQRRETVSAAVVRALTTYTDNQGEKVMDINSLPIGSMINAHWADSSQPDHVVIRIDGDGGAGSGGYSLLGGKHWEQVGSWGAELSVLYRP